MSDDQMVCIDDVMATIEKVGNFGDYTREELTPEYGQPRFDMMNSILQAVFAMPTVQPDIVAPAECNCDDPDCGFNHAPLTLRKAYDNCVARLRGSEGALLSMQQAAGMALLALPSNQQDGVVGEFLASIHRHCASALSRGHGGDGGNP